MSAGGSGSADRPTKPFLGLDPCSWYHFLWPGNIQAQAEWFVHCANPQPGGVLACDWETTLSKTAASCAKKDAFLAAVKKLRPHLRVVLYCNLDFWKRRDTTEKCGDGLWIADPNAEAGHPRVTHTWVIHQYGIHKHTDVNACNFKTVQAWKDWAGALAPKPTPKPAPKPYAPPKFPAGLAPGKSRPSAKSLQKARPRPTTTAGSCSTSCNSSMSWASSHSCTRSPTRAGIWRGPGRDPKSVHVLASEYVHEELACLIEVGHGEADVVQTGQPGMT